MRTWTPEQVARAAGARLVAPASTTTGPERAVIDSREAGPGALFVGLRGENVDGGRFAPQALAAGAWGVLTTPDHAEAARCAVPGALIAAEDPLAAMQRLAASLASRARRARDRRHRVHRQDLDQGPAPRAARRPSAARSPRGPTSTPRSGSRLRSSRRRRAPRCWCSRWRCGEPARSPSWPRSPRLTSA